MDSTGPQEQAKRTYEACSALARIMIVMVIWWGVRLIIIGLAPAFGWVTTLWAFHQVE
jgi:uncharacterized membrane protein YesL